MKVRLPVALFCCLALWAPCIGAEQSAARTTKQELQTAVAQLNAPGAAQRVQALNRLAQLGPAAAPAVPNIINVLNQNHPDFAGGGSAMLFSPQVTSAAIDALSRIGPPASQASAYLVNMLTDSNEMLRRSQILKALDSIGVDDSATSTIVRVLGEEGKFTENRVIAIRLLGKIDPPPVEALDVLKQIAGDSTDGKSREAALHVISLIGKRRESVGSANSDDSTAELVRQIREQLARATSRDQKLEGLAKISDVGEKAATLLPLLLQLLNSSDKQIVAADIDALASIGTGASAATAPLVSRLFVERDESARHDIMRAICAIDGAGKNSIPLVAPLLDDPFKAPTAIALLDELGTPDSTAIAARARKRWCLK